MHTNDPSPGNLIPHLHHVLTDTSQNPSPHVPSPPGVPKRASVALIIRIKPRHDQWPPTGEHALFPTTRSTADRLSNFFNNPWVSHGDPEVLFIKRSSRQGDKWQGHVALPGGGRDPEDEDDLATAVRETWEEVGIDLVDGASEKGEGLKGNCLHVGGLPGRVVMGGWV